ncbi:MAG TPA: hypothetical protein VMH86_07410 [Rhizomicrobium sp.]|nr:hypothetical protein [Rhizomicrobium sp.]
MSARGSAFAAGQRVFGLGMIAVGVVGLMWAQPLPSHFPGYADLVYGLVTLAGAAVLWPRTAAWGAGALALYYALVVVIYKIGPVLLLHYNVYGPYENLAEGLAIASGALLVFAANAAIDPTLAMRLTQAGQIAFGVCAVIFGGAHFAYMNLTAPLVPKWLPPSQEFWACATGIAQIAAGAAILSRVWARLAVRLLAAMYASFIPLVFAPILMADPSNHFRWNECVETLALTGVAWIVAESLAGSTWRRTASGPA